MEYGIIVIALIVVVVALFVRFGIPRYAYRFGKNSRSLTNNGITCINTAKKWRVDMIYAAEQSGVKELLVKAGEFGPGMIETVESALNKGFNVTVVSGNKTHCASKDKIIQFLEKCPNFKYYVLDYRPEDHFAIIGQYHLFIEVPHVWNAQIKDSLGIEDAYDNILDKFKIKYENTIETATKRDINFVRTMECYDEGIIACTVT